MSAILKQPAERYRPMLPSDLAEVMEIEARAYDYPWTRGIFRDCLRVGYACWLALRDEVIQGYGVMSVAAGEAHVLNLSVRPESRRQGVGERLLLHLTGIARRHGAEALFLEVRPSNRPALHLYTKLGFNEVGVRRNYYPSRNGREDALILALQLRSPTASH